MEKLMEPNIYLYLLYYKYIITTNLNMKKINNIISIKFYFCENKTRINIICLNYNKIISFSDDFKYYSCFS